MRSESKEHQPITSILKVLILAHIAITIIVEHCRGSGPVPLVFSFPLVVPCKPTFFRGHTSLGLGNQVQASGLEEQKASLESVKGM